MFSNSPDSFHGPEKKEKAEKAPEQRSESLDNAILNASEGAPDAVQNLGLGEGFQQASAEGIRESFSVGELVKDEHDFCDTLPPEIGEILDIAHFAPTQQEAEGYKPPLG